jgi:hypothetical protein
VTPTAVKKCRLMYETQTERDNWEDKHLSGRAILTCKLVFPVKYENHLPIKIKIISVTGRSGMYVSCKEQTKSLYEKQNYHITGRGAP